MLASALLIMLVGSLLMLELFTLSTSFSRTTLVQRRAYRDYLDTMSHVEEAKGYILARNKTRVLHHQPVLHGRAMPASEDYFDVHSIGDLLIDDATLSRDVVLAPQDGAPRRLTVRVYDANYLVDRVKFTPGPDMPPSLYPANVERVESFVPGEGEESGVDETNFFRSFGAYLIRVELFRGSSTVPSRRMEMAFSQFLNPTELAP